MTTTPTAPAAWYPDPAAPGLVRYWNGTQWVGEAVPPPSAPSGVAPAAVAAAEAPKRPRSTVKVVLIAVVCLGVFIAVLSAIVGAGTPDKPSNGLDEASLQVSNDLAKQDCETAVTNKVQPSGTPKFYSEDITYNSKAKSWPPFTTTGVISADGSKYLFGCLTTFNTDGTVKATNVVYLNNQ